MMGDLWIGMSVWVEKFIDPIATFKAWSMVIYLDPKMARLRETSETSMLTQFPTRTIVGQQLSLSRTPDMEVDGAPILCLLDGEG